LVLNAMTTVSYCRVPEQEVGLTFWGGPFLTTWL